jgi:hypothetical protein
MIHGNGRVKRLIAGGAVALLGLTFGTSNAAQADVASFCAAIPTGQSGFTDIAAAGVHQRNVECLKGSGITQGTTATTYSPQANNTRGQMATFIANMIDKADELDSPSDARTIPSLPTAAASADAFTDDETSVHENNINRLAQADIIQGTTATTFSPEAPVSRAQMATFIAEALEFIRGAALPEGPDAFTDDETSVHEANINRLANAGIVQGTGASANGKAVYSPSGLVSRAQMASFIIQALADLFDDGFIRALPGAAAPSLTARPELRTAQIVRTVSTAAGTANDPAGTTIRYCFDENIVTANAGDFFVYEFNNPENIHGGDAIVGAVSGQCVDVRHTDIVNTAANAPAGTTTADLSVATVEFGAVTDGEGLGSPEGDAPLGTGQQGNATLTAGQTTAPDLVSVTGFRTPATGSAANSAAVDFTFDANAFVQVPNGFVLVSLDGFQTTCTGPGPATTNTTNPGGAAAAGGNGTTVITVNCLPFSGGQSANQNLVTGNGQAPAFVARGNVFSGTVGSVSQATAACSTAGAGTEGGQNTAAPSANACNPLQATAQPHASSQGPDLVSVTFQPAAAGSAATTPDIVIYAFDQQITPAVPAANSQLFRIYNNNGQEIAAPASGNTACGGSACPGPQTGTGTSNNQVAIAFPKGSLASAVGGNVLDNAVTGVGGVPNQQDEAPASNVTQPNTTQQPAGSTTGPDLTGVTLTAQRNAFNEVTGFTATYTFDEPIVELDSTNLNLYLANGTNFVCGGAAGDATVGAAPNNNQITCNTFNLTPVAGPGGAITNSVPLGAATLGTVEFAAVEDASGNSNVEGAQATTGGNGTPQ